MEEKDESLNESMNDDGVRRAVPGFGWVCLRYILIKMENFFLNNFGPLEVCTETNSDIYL